MPLDTLFPEPAMRTSPARLFAILLLPLYSMACLAGDELLLTLPQAPSSVHASRLAAAQAWQPAAGGETTAAAAEEDFRTPLFTPNRLHEYLGFGSLIAAGLAAATPPDDDEDENGGTSDGDKDDGFHHNAAVTAAVLGGLAVATGFLFHHDDIGPSYGLGDPDNLHMMLGLLGTLGYATAVSKAPDEVHAAAGITGLASMAVAIKLEW